MFLTIPVDKKGKPTTDQSRPHITIDIEGDDDTVALFLLFLSKNGADIPEVEDLSTPLLTRLF